jgi:hypothetical protein
MQEKVEAYVKDKKSVGCLRATHDLNVTSEDLFKIVNNSDKIVFDNNKKSVNWRNAFGEGEGRL